MDDVKIVAIAITPCLFGEDVALDDQLSKRSEVPLDQDYFSDVPIALGPKATECLNIAIPDGSTEGADPTVLLESMAIAQHHDGMINRR